MINASPNYLGGCIKNTHQKNTTVKCFLCIYHKLSTNKKKLIIINNKVIVINVIGT